MPAIWHKIYKRSLQTVKTVIKYKGKKMIGGLILPILKARITDESGVRRALMRIAHEITENNKGIDGVIVVGVKRRGITLGNIICDNLEKIEGIRPQMFELDVTNYRDDLEKQQSRNAVAALESSFDVNGKKVVIVDDVIYTGRTARAALEAIFSMGRPSKIQLAVLVDRGHRELPIGADYVGKTIPTSKNEIVKVNTGDFDGEFGIDLFEKE